jgi:hypothetical protein
MTPDDVAEWTAAIPARQCEPAPDDAAGVVPEPLALLPAAGKQAHF